MGGGGAFDGLRRWFHRRSCVTTADFRPVDLPEDESITSAAASSSSATDCDFSHLKPVRVPNRFYRHNLAVSDPQKKDTAEKDFFTEYGEANRYEIQEVIGKGSYGVVASAIDTHTGEKVAIKKINDVFEHISDATRILREIKLLRLLHHPDVVQIRHIMLPPSRREFRDIYVVFELMESDLHQIIKANSDLTAEHQRFFLYQLLRGLKYIHAAKVFHRDLKPKNILANANCKLKICDFGLARVSFDDAPSAIYWTDYVATRWYRAPELCGSFFSKTKRAGALTFYASYSSGLTKCLVVDAFQLKYTPAIDIWSIGCIFAELLTRKPLFPGKNIVHQLDIMTDLLGTPSTECISRIRNEKAKRYLNNMRKKSPVPFSQKIPNADPLALRMLERLLAFDPKDRPTAEEALSDPYFHGLSAENEPTTHPISKLEFAFERKKLNKDDVRELIYREILEYHPQMLQEYLSGTNNTSFLYPSGVDRFKRQFAHLEEHFNKGQKGAPLQRKHASLPRERVNAPRNEVDDRNANSENGSHGKASLPAQNGNLMKSDSISASQCTTVTHHEKNTTSQENKEINQLSIETSTLHV